MRLRVRAPHRQAKKKKKKKKGEREAEGKHHTKERLGSPALTVGAFFFGLGPVIS